LLDKIKKELFEGVVLADLKSFLDQLLNSITVSDVVGKYVELKQSGANFFGLCPFHQEKSPSFSVNNQKKIYHCFGCGASGSALNFLMNYKELPFKKALIELAQEAGISLPPNFNLKKIKKQASEKEKLIALHQRAAQVYHQSLLKSSPTGQDYLLKKRNFSSQIIQLFYLGYAPPQWDTLTQLLKEAPLTLLEKSGLFGKSKKGIYDRFRDKIMFPIFNVKGQIIAFGSRVLDDSKPKYINSPETPIFKKKETLYGLNFAVESIRKKGFAYVVEGYVDTIAMHQAGFSNTVAPLGTAFSQSHIQVLSHYTQEAVLLFDGDDAGKKAAFRSLDEALSVGFSVKIVNLPNNLDPDDFIKERGIKAFKEFLKSFALSWEDYLIKPLIQETNILNRRKKIIEVLKIFLNKDFMITQQFLKKLSSSLSLNFAEMENYFKKMAQKNNKNFQNQPSFQEKSPKTKLPLLQNPDHFILKLEQEIVLLLLNNPTLYLQNQEDLTPAFFSTNQVPYRIFSVFIQSFNQKEFQESLFFSLVLEEDLKDLKNFLFDAQGAKKYQIEPEKQLEQLKIRMRLNYIQEQIQKTKKNFLLENHNQLKFLLEQEQELKKRLSSF